MFKPSVRPRGLNVANARQVHSQKQRSERQQVLRSAKVIVDGVNDQQDCTIRDISPGGCRISVARPADAPNTFLIIARSDEWLARAQVAWRRGHELGLRFVRKGGLHQEDEFRREQANAYAAQQRAAQQHTAQTANAFKASAQADARAQYCRTMKLDPTLDYSPEQLKSRYRTLAMRAHPDHGGSVAEFQALTKAYNALCGAVGAIA